MSKPAQSPNRKTSEEIINTPRPLNDRTLIMYFSHPQRLVRERPEVTGRHPHQHEEQQRRRQQPTCEPTEHCGLNGPGGQTHTLAASGNRTIVRGHTQTQQTGQTTQRDSPRLAGERKPIIAKNIEMHDIPMSWQPVPTVAHSKRGNGGGRRTSAWTNFHPLSCTGFVKKVGREGGGEGPDDWGERSPMKPTSLPSTPRQP